MRGLRMDSRLIKEVIEGFSNWHIEHGDALKVLGKMPSESVGALITDPPYSSVGNASQTTGSKYVQSGTKLVRPDFMGDTLDQRSWFRWCSAWLGEARRIAKPGAIAAVFIDWRQLPTLTDALQCAGWVWQGIAVWDKTLRSRPRMGGFRSQTEFIVWGSAGKLVGNKSITVPGCLSYPRTADDRVHHQTSKPVELMRQLVRLCPEDDIVLDPFAGSGSTGVACNLEGRRFIGVELTRDYYERGTGRLCATA